MLDLNELQPFTIVGILIDESESVHFGSARTWGEFLILHERDDGVCCEGAVIVVAMRRVTQIEVYTDGPALETAKVDEKIRPHGGDKKPVHGIEVM